MTAATIDARHRTSPQCHDMATELLFHSRQSSQRTQHKRNTNHQSHYLGDGHAEPDAFLTDDRGEQKHGNQHENNASAEGDYHRLQWPLDGGVEAASHNIDERH